MYGVPGTVNSPAYPYNQLSQTVPGNQGYPAFPGYAMPGHPIMQLGGPNVNAMATSSVPTIPVPYPTGNIYRSI